ncbi:MAG: molybdopterin-dependent oxidoreductase, partial [Candidatus Binatia bacterium]
ILCARCTRFVDEVTHTSELGIYERGDHSRIELAAGKTLDNPYSMNVVDICPVGALTSKDFRFKARVWYLERTESVCAGCANGCNIEVYHREGRIFRFQPRANAEVNQYWMCDEGRLSCHALQGEGRLLQPLVRGEGAFVPVEWTNALEAVAGRLRGIAREGGAGAIALVISAQASNEEIFLARRLATQLDATITGVSWSPPNASHDDFLVKADKNPNTRGLVLQGLPIAVAGLESVLGGIEAGRVKALVLVRTDLASWASTARARAALEAVPYLVVLDSDRRESSQYADVVLPIATYAETAGTFTNHTGRVQRFDEAVKPAGDARPGWRVLSDLLVSDAMKPAADARGVFAALASEGGAFAGLSYEVLGAEGANATNARASA